MEEFVCLRCGNKDPKYIGIKNGKQYCRRCISMIGELAKERGSDRKSAYLKLDYFLTNEQSNISKAVIKSFKDGKNTLIYAVTGAGKTELVYGVIQYALKMKMNVGFAVPRKQVVIELANRIERSFPRSKIVSIYGEHHDDLLGDIIVLTTHQLYRFESFFDLLILDEIDAFPYKNNGLLNEMFYKSCRGNYVLMSATPDKKIIRQFSKKGYTLLTLKTRYHKQPIPVPKLIVSVGIIKYLTLLKTLKNLVRKKKQVFIFCPTINECEFVYKFLSKFTKKGSFIHSKVVSQNSIIDRFRKGEYVYLVTTAVLERGITVKGLQVIVFDADSSIYDEYSLVQIAGRVGRNVNEPFGEVIFIAKKKNKAIADSIATIEECNSHL